MPICHGHHRERPRARHLEGSGLWTLDTVSYTVQYQVPGMAGFTSELHVVKQV